MPKPHRDASTPGLRTGLIQLDGLSPSQPLDDLRALSGIAGESRVVALGEPTHGQREMYHLRHRLTRYLVECCGFTVIALEANAPECDAVDRFIKAGTGSVNSAVNGLSYWLYRTEEMKELVLWAREWNSLRPAGEQLSFIGMDSQIPKLSANRLLRHISKHHAEKAPTWRASLEVLAQLTMWDRQADEPTSDELRDVLSDISNTMDTNPEDSHHRDIQLLEQFLLKRDTASNEERWDLRDRFMAGNVMQRLEDDAKAIVWAHNGHVTKDAGWLFDTGLTPMGMHLARQLGEEYVPVGFAFGSGSLRAVVDFDSDDLRISTALLGPPPVDSLDALLLDATQAPAAILDLRAVDGELRAWLDAPRVSRTTGADFVSEEATHSTPNVMRSYDVLVFVRETTGTRPLMGND